MSGAPPRTGDPPSIPLVDLRAEHAALRDDLDVAIGSVIESQLFILGPVVEALEGEMADYLRTPHAIGCASGTDALLLALRALDEDPEVESTERREVIVPAFTFFATAGAVWNAGFTPVFCDVDPGTFTVTAETLEAAWSERTRAVIPVHLFGQMAPMAEIDRLARDRGAVVLEDAAQAIGATQAVEGGEVRAGAAGRVAAISFFPSKNLGAFGDAGMVVTRDAALADRVRKLRVHGGHQMYHHEMVGTNSRLDALQAAVLRVKLPHLDRRSAARRKNARLYHELLADLDEVVLPEVAPGNSHVYNQYTLRVRRRDELRHFLTGRGIGSGLYYPVPLHLQECFRPLGFGPGDFPVAEQLCHEVLSLPVFPELGDERIERVARAIREFFRGA